MAPTRSAPSTMMVALATLFEHEIFQLPDPAFVVPRGLTRFS